MVNISEKDGDDLGSATVTISDGTDTTEVELTNDNYNPTADAWQYVFSPLDTSKTYTITAVGDGVNIGTLSTEDTTTITPAATSSSDYTITYATQSIPRTITVTVPEEHRTTNGWLSFNLFKFNTSTRVWDYVPISDNTLSNANSWTQLVTGLDSTGDYKIGLGDRYHTEVFDGATISPDGAVTFENNTATVTVTPILAENPRLKVTESNLSDSDSG